MARSFPSKKEPPRRVAGVDADELEAVSVAASTLKSLCPSAVNPQAIAHAVISAWIIERMKRHTTSRLHEHVIFNLADAKLAGMVEAALPKIGGVLAGAGFPFDVAFSDLTKPQAVTLFLAGVVAHREAAVAAGESSDFPFAAVFDDPIPFGGEAKPVPFEAGCPVQAAADALSRPSGPITDEEIPF